MRQSFRQSVKRHITPEIKGKAYSLFNEVTNVHRSGALPNIFIFTSPRSGSTWLTELIWSQPGFRCVNEPLYLCNPLVARALGISSWDELAGLPPVALAKLQNYIQGCCDGRIHAAEPAPFRNRFYRFSTRQTVLKVIHGGEDRINWFRDSFNGRILYFIRHPIAVSLSHEEFPRLQAFITSAYSENFTDRQLREAKHIMDKGSHLERGVLNWCFQNALPLRQATPDWALLTYEQLVLEPEVCIDYLADKLDLPDTEKMVSRLGKASSVLHKSDLETQQLLREGAAQKRSQLVDKWRNKVLAAQERRAMEILELFGISAYQLNSPLPAAPLWIKEGNDPAHQKPLASTTRIDEFVGREAVWGRRLQAPGKVHGDQERVAGPL